MSRVRTTQKEIIKFTRGVPAIEAFPTEQLIACSETALRKHGNTLLQYHPVRGFLPLREVLAEQAGVEVNRVLTSNGSIQILDLLTRVLLEPGDTLLVERPTYDRTITTLRRVGAVVRGVPLEPDGLDIAALKQAVKETAPKFIYVIPDFQNPTGCTLSLGKREAVLDLADRYDFAVITDVPYRRLRYWGEDVQSMSQICPHRVIELSSFSKLISPGMRVGWMVAPEDLVDRVARVAEDAYICPSMLSQGIIYEFLNRGWMPKTIARLRALYAPRLEALLTGLKTHLSKAEWFKPEGGFFVGVTLPEDTSAARMREAVRDEGVFLSDGAGFFADGDGSRFLRLPFCALSEAEIEEALKRLACAIGKACRSPSKPIKEAGK
jgi:2-aminoadipate transaminase